MGQNICQKGLGLQEELSSEDLNNWLDYVTSANHGRHKLTPDARLRVHFIKNKREVYLCKKFTYKNEI